jgi:hypothetical protein
MARRPEDQARIREVLIALGGSPEVLDPKEDVSAGESTLASRIGAQVEFVTNPRKAQNTTPAEPEAKPDTGGEYRVAAAAAASAPKRRRRTPVVRPVVARGRTAAAHAARVVVAALSAAWILVRRVVVRVAHAVVFAVVGTATALAGYARARRRHVDEPEHPGEDVELGSTVARVQAFTSSEGPPVFAPAAAGASSPRRRRRASPAAAIRRFVHSALAAVGTFVRSAGRVIVRVARAVALVVVGAATAVATALRARRRADDIDDAEEDENLGSTVAARVHAFTYTESELAAAPAPAPVVRTSEPVVAQPSSPQTHVQRRVKRMPAAAAALVAGAGVAGLVALVLVLTHGHEAGAPQAQRQTTGSPPPPSEPVPSRASFSNPRAYAAAMTRLALTSGQTTLDGQPACTSDSTWNTWTCHARGKPTLGAYAGRWLTYQCSSSYAPQSGRPPAAPTIGCRPVNPPSLTT